MTSRVVGHIAGYGEGGGGRGAARSRWKAGPSVVIGVIMDMLNYQANNAT